VNRFERFYNFLANMGLVLRDDPPKVIDMTGRLWGAAADGLALSIRELPRDESGQVAGISVVLRNGGTEPRILTAQIDAFFYRIEGLPLSPYGQQLLASRQKGRKSKDPEVTLAPGDAIETELPVARIYEMRAPGEYTLRVSCRLPEDRMLESNEISVRV